MLLGAITASAVPVYMRSQIGAPWGRNANETAMDEVFGVGGWQDRRFETSNPSQVFSGSNYFVFLEGGDSTTNALESFVDTNRALIESWVSAGGTLLLTAAPNTGDGMLIGFGGVSITVGTYSSDATVVATGHPIFHGPFGTVGSPLHGSSFAHGTITGGTVTPLIQSTSGVLLAELSLGAGHAFVGTLTMPFFDASNWTQPDSRNLQRNLLFAGACSNGVDTDGDGAYDGCDNCPAIANALQTDTDGDYVGDACNDADDADGDEYADSLDNCPAIANPAQTDTDGDGLGDACNDADDADGDEYADSLDNCPAIANPAQTDTDGDGLGDACNGADDADGDEYADSLDNCPTIANPAQTDTDGDEIGDDCDNCPLVRNASQTDTDGDLMGDACDIDTDADGLNDDFDNCRFVANPGQEDGDGDDVGDVCDNCPVDPNPASGGSAADWLAALNANYESITGLVPTRYDFSEGATGTNIGDGGGDMYDGGNVLGTNLLSGIPYTNSTITIGDSAFGPGSNYFTAKFPGLFVAAAENIDISTFTITGNNGADGSGSVDSTEIDISVGGQPYRLFVKRVYAAGDPSINHIILVRGDGTGMVHSIGPSTNDDFDQVTNLEGISDIFYLLTARSAGAYLSDDDVIAIASAFITTSISEGQTDTDGDGDGDACDADDDDDGVLDGSDNCSITANPGQEDLDGDSLGDACDSDIDGDGDLNGSDNCPVDANPAQTDCDHDGTGDTCDPGTVDTDADGVDAGCDNCPGAANASQLDSDSDGYGDACDICPIDSHNDVDNDGVCADVDNCPRTFNPDQANEDANDLGDACDPCTFLDFGQILSVKPLVQLGGVNLDTTPGNDRLAISGQFTLPPSARFYHIGPQYLPVRIRVVGYGGNVILDQELPTTSYAGNGSRGWSLKAEGTTWQYSDKTGSPVAGITKVQITDRDLISPRAVFVRVKAAHGTYPTTFGDEPLTAWIVLGDPESGVCTMTDFEPRHCAYGGGGTSLKCKD